MKISTNCSSLVILGDFPPLLLAPRTNDVLSGERGDLVP